MIKPWFKSSQGLSSIDEPEDSILSTAVENPAFLLVLTPPWKDKGNWRKAASNHKQKLL